MRQKIKQILKSDQAICWIILSIYIILITYISLHHEFTQDETQSWLIARDLNPIDIIKQMKWEGHSFLWHYLLLPFAKLGLPIYVQKILPICFSTATIYILWKHAPFSKLLKFLITFSSGMIYYYSSFARPYCMIPFLLVAIATVYQKRKERPYLYAILVGLLAHTHLVMLPTVGLLVITFWLNELLLKRKKISKEEKGKLIKSFILVISIILIYFIIAVYGYFYCKIATDISRYTEVTTYIPYWASYTLHSISSTFYGGEVVPNYYIFLLAGITLLCIIGSKNNIKQAIIFWIQIIFMILVHCMVWFSLPIRIFIIIYTLMFWVWMDYYEKKKNSWTTVALILLIIISIPGTYKCVFQDIQKKASGGSETAEFIKENIPKGSVFINTYSDFHQILAAYLKKEDYLFYLIHADEFRTFNVWDEEILKYTTANDVINAIEKLKKSYSHIYLLNPVVTKNYGVDMSKISKKYQVKYLYVPKEKDLMDEFYFLDLVTFEIIEISERK